MFPEFFLIDNRDIVVLSGEKHRVCSTWGNLRRSKLILINRTNLFCEKRNNKVTNALVKKFGIEKDRIFEMNTNLRNVVSKGRVKIKKIQFEELCSVLSDGGFGFVNKLTNIDGIPFTITGVMGFEGGGIMTMIFTDAPLPREILEEFLNNLKNTFLKRICLSNNCEFLNSLTFVSKRIGKQYLKIKNYENKALLHFKNSLNSMLDELSERFLEKNLNGKRILKVEVGLKSKRKSLEVLDRIAHLFVTKKILERINEMGYYCLLEKILSDLLKDIVDIQKLSFHVNGIEVFNDTDDVKVVLEKLDLILSSNKNLVFSVLESGFENRRGFVKYCLI